MKRKLINRRCLCDLELDFLDSFPENENFEGKVCRKLRKISKS